MKRKVIIMLEILFLIILLIASFIILFKKNNQNINIKNDKLEMQAENNVNAIVELIYFNAFPYKKVILPGENLINGSYGNRSIYLLEINGIDEIKNIEYKNEKKVFSFNNRIYKKGENLFIASVCDNIINPDNKKIKVKIDGIKNNKDIIIEKNLNILKEKTNKNIVKNQEEIYFISDPIVSFKQNTDKPNLFQIKKQYKILSLSDKNSKIEIKDLKLNTKDLKEYKISNSIKINDVLEDNTLSELTSRIGEKNIEWIINIETKLNEPNVEEILKRKIKNININF